MLMARPGIRRTYFLHTRGKTPRDFFPARPPLQQVSNNVGGGDKLPVNAHPVCATELGSNHVNCRPQLRCSDVSLERYIERKIGFKSVVPPHARSSVVNHPERSAAINANDCTT